MSNYDKLRLERDLAKPEEFYARDRYERMPYESRMHHLIIGLVGENDRLFLNHAEFHAWVEQTAQDLIGLSSRLADAYAVESAQKRQA